MMILSQPSERDRRVLRFIIETVRLRGFPPTVREIGTELGLRSSHSTHVILQRLISRGYLKRDAHRPRTLVVMREWDDIPTLVLPEELRIALDAVRDSRHLATERFQMIMPTKVRLALDLLVQAWENHRDNAEGST